MSAMTERLEKIRKDYILNSMHPNCLPLFLASRHKTAVLGFRVTHALPGPAVQGISGL